MEEWIEKTRDYLYTDEDGKEKIHGAVEWTQCFYVGGYWIKPEWKGQDTQVEEVEIYGKN